MGVGPLRILLIDDDEDSFVIARGLLSQIQGPVMTLDWVSSYEEGLDAIRQHQHDVYLLDFRLGARNGLDLLREAMQEGCAAPIVMLTGQGDHEIDVDALQAGAMDYLVKDEINASVLERSIRYAHQRQGLLSKLKESAEALERNNVQLQQFAYVASHDLQAPLRRILSFCQLLQRRLQGKLDTDSDEFIGYIVEGAKGMQTLVSDLLTFSRVGTQGKPFKPVDSSVVLDEARRNLEMSVQETNATITRDTLPTVVVDRTQLVQLFQNLLSNAIKYRGDQTPKIHVTAEEKSGEWLFGIRDNGIGIDPKHHSDIFAIFKRLHGDEIPGTGIGLAVCKRIVERHKGRIWVESQLGQGSTFYFTIPKLPVS